MSGSIYGRKWQLARAGYLHSHPLCAMCDALGRVEVATVVDHIKPHRLSQAIATGDQVALAAARRLFWDSSNWQALCKQCHDSHKQRFERSGVVAGADQRGMPIDPSHHWARG